MGKPTTPRRSWTEVVGGIDDRDRAAHRYYEQLRERAVEQRMTGAGRDRVDGGNPPDQAELAQGRRISASEMVRRIRGYCGVETLRLLDALELNDCCAEPWRRPVQAITGESNPVAQAACARQALRGLVTALTLARIDLDRLLTD